MKNLTKEIATLVIVILSVTGIKAQTSDLAKIPTDQSSSFAVPEKSVTIIAWTNIKAGSEAAIVKATKTMTDKIRANEPGCLLFEAHQGATAPGLIIFYEVFKDEAAFNNHQQAAYVKDWFDAIQGLTTSPMNVNRMTNLDTYE